MPVRIPGRDLKVPKIPFAMLTTEDFSVRENPGPLGEHTDSILSELGYSDSEIEALKTSDVVLKGSDILDVDKTGG